MISLLMPSVFVDLYRGVVIIRSGRSKDHLHHDASFGQAGMRCAAFTADVKKVRQNLEIRFAVYTALVLCCQIFTFVKQRRRLIFSVFFAISLRRYSFFAFEIP